MSCSHCGWPVIYDEAAQAWAHITDRPLNKHFCWDSKDYADADYAEPTGSKNFGVDEPVTSTHK